MYFTFCIFVISKKKGKTPGDYKEEKGEIIKLRDEAHDDEDDDDDDENEDNTNGKDTDTVKDADNDDHTEETTGKEDAAET